jgi:pimeloyl-ACP methyl ester carboxylesterase
MTDPRLQGWNHLAPDLPGYGKSFWAGEPLGLADFAERLKDLLPLISDQRIVVVGHSMGGVVGTLLMESLSGEDAKRIAAFVDIEGNISIGDCGFSAKAAGQSLDGWLDGGFEALLALIQGMDEDPAINRAYGASAMMADPRAFHLNSRELVQHSAAETLAPRLAALEHPTLFCYGFPRGMSSRSLELLQQSQIQTLGVDDAGHWFFLERPDAFVEPFVVFLQGLDGTRP